MTTINSQEDFLRALRENPEWKDVVRALILSEELLQIPTRFNAFVDEQREEGLPVRQVRISFGSNSQLASFWVQFQP